VSPRSHFPDRNGTREHRGTREHGTRKHRGRLAAAALGTAVVLAGLTGCAPSSGPDADGVTTLDFFQFKPEAVQDFADIITDFEAENPDIRVVQNAVPDADTAIRTLLVKNKVPDVLTLNVSGNFAELARACVFADLSDEPSADTVNPAVQEIVQDLGSWSTPSPSPTTPRASSTTPTSSRRRASRSPRRGPS
jgi:raffinose/stachyose/melibiose transport system substrate-binding protein